MKKTLTLIVPVLLVAFVVSSCGIHLNTPEKKYLAAREELNMLLEQYLQIQDKVSDEDHKKATIGFQAADLALDMWEATLGTTDDYATDIRKYIQAKNYIIEVMKAYIQVKEVK